MDAVVDFFPDMSGGAMLVARAVIIGIEAGCGRSGRLQYRNDIIHGNLVRQPCQEISSGGAAFDFDESRFGEFEDDFFQIGEWDVLRLADLTRGADITFMGDIYDGAQTVAGGG